MMRKITQKIVNTTHYPLPNSFPTVFSVIIGLCLSFYSTNSLQAQCDIFINLSETSGANIADGIVCAGATVTLTGSGSGAGDFSYAWSNGLGSGTSIMTSFGTRSQVTVNPVMNTTYTVTVTDNSGCTSTESISIVISNQADIPSLADAITCPNTSDTLAVTGNGGYTYLWSNSETDSFIVAPAGDYSVTVTDTNSVACATVLTASVVESPDPEFSGIYNICNGNAVTLDPFSGSTPTGFTYTWTTLPSGETVPNNTQQLSTTVPGTYVVSVSSTGCTTVGTDTVNVTAVSNPVAELTVSESGMPSDLVICPGDLFEVSSLTSGTSFSWSVPNGETQPSTTDSTFSASTAGIYSVTITDGSTCAPVGSITIANGEPTPVLFANPGNNICSGESVTFSAANGGINPTYQLYIKSNGTTSTFGESTSTPVWAVPSLIDGDTVWVEATNAQGCSNTSNQIGMTVNTFNPILVASPSNVVCANTTVTYFAGSGVSGVGVQGSMYEFFVNGVSQGVTSSNIFSPTTLNNGDVVGVHITDPNGCSGNAQNVTMTVNPALVVTLTTSDTVICSGENATFTATNNSGLSGVTYQFFLNGVAQANTGNVFSSNSLVTGDSLYVTATTPGAGGCTAQSNIIEINAGSVAPTITTHTGETTFCVNDIITFIAGGGISYEFFVNGVSQGVSNINALTTNSLSIGTNTVSVTVTNANGCASTIAAPAITITATPSVGLTQTATSICEGTTVAFTANGPSGSMYEFFVDGISSQGPSSTNTFSTSNLENGDIVTVTVNQSNSCSPTLTFNQVTVSNTTSAGTISGSNALCQGSTTQLTNSSTITNGTWLSSNTSVATVNAAGMVTAVSSGTANITYTITSGNCTSTTPVFPVFVSATGSLSIVPSSNAICVGESVTLAANAGAGASYTWTASTGGNLPATSSITVSPTVTTTYFVSSTGGDCSGNSSVTITVNSVPVAGAITGSTQGSAIICEGGALSLQASANGTGTITWNSSDPSVATVSATGAVVGSTTLTTLPATTIITYTVTSNNGCTDTSPAYMVTVMDCIGTPATTVCLEAKAFLEGPFETTSSLMNDALRSLPTAMQTNLTTLDAANSPFPLTEPYTVLPNFTHVGDGGGETTTNAVLAVSGNNAIVDWVFIELRDGSDSSNVVATKSALIQRDGDIVDAVDGVSPVCITANTNDYFVAIRHRNHLGILSKNPVSFTTGMTSRVDMSTTITSVSGYMAINGINPVDTIGTSVAMYGGDAGSDGRIIFNGPSNDRDEVFFTVFQDPANNNASYNHVRTGYYNGDTNLDGSVTYQGPGNDLDRLMFFNVLFHECNSARLTNYTIFQQIEPPVINCP